MTNPTLDVLQLLISQLSLFLALLLTASAVHKGARFRRALGAARALAGLDESTASAAVIVAGLWEVSAAVLLWFPGMRTVGALLAAALFTIYLALIAHAISKDRRDVDCGCSFGTARRALGPFEAVRNSCLVAFALFIVLFASDGAQAAVSSSDILPGLVLLVIYYALDEVMGVRSTMERVIK